MSESAFRQFVHWVRVSRLVDDDELKQQFRKFRDSARAHDDASELSAEGFADHLRRCELLTTWQCKKLLAGKTLGLRLGEYRILDILGIGGMGRVFLALDGSTNNVALKVLSSDKAKHAETRERFYREAEALALLNHENIVRVMDVGQAEGRHFIAMEYVQGEDLQRVVQRDGPCRPEKAIDYTRQTALGLAHAHRAGLIHRDIKPANLLLNEVGKIKILDLGLARIIDVVDEDVEGLGMGVGTVDFVSPEQAANSDELDLRTDIYSLGCTLFFLLAGRAPFQSGSAEERLDAHRFNSPPSVNYFRQQLGLGPVCAGVTTVLERMLAKQPAARYPRVFALIADLDAIASPHTAG